MTEISENEIKTNVEEIAETFDDMNLNPKLLRGIFAYGYSFVNKF